MKIVLNRSYGGFSLSPQVIEFLALRGKGGMRTYSKIDRTDPDLIAAVETLGDGCVTWTADLAIVEIPDGTDYVIKEYDGKEWVSVDPHIVPRY